MPAWKFLMKYDGIPSRPAGVIYDCLDDDTHFIPRFAIPDAWRRWCWIDFGNNNTAVLKLAEEPRENQKPRFICYDAYRPEVRRKAGGPDGHVSEVTRGEPMTPFGVGGSHQEDGWRESWAGAGLPVKEPPNNKIDVQIAQTWEALANQEILFFDDLKDVRDEFDNYAWPVDENGEVLRDDKPENDQMFHFMAALRYGGCFINPPKAKIDADFNIY